MSLKGTDQGMQDDRIGEPPRLDDEAVERRDISTVQTIEQIVERLKQIATNGAA